MPVKSQPIVYHSVILVRILIVNICHDRDHESRTKTARAAKCNTLLGCGDYSFVGKTTIIRKQILTKYHEKVLKKFVLCNLIGFFQEDFKTVTMVFHKDPDHKKKTLNNLRKSKSAKNNFEIYWLKNIVMLVFGYDTLLSHSFVDSTYLAHTKALEFSKVIEKSSYRAQPIVLHIGPTQMKGIGMAVDAQAKEGIKHSFLPFFLVAQLTSYHFKSLAVRNAASYLVIENITFELWLFPC